MSFEITLNIDENSPQAQNIDALADNQHISREEAALQLLAKPARKSAASAEALEILGGFRDDSALMDEVLEIAMTDRQRRNSALPHE